MSFRLVAWLPEQIALSPERALINVACVLIGVATLFERAPESVSSTWPDWLVVEWSLGMMLGGLLALFGYICLARSAARVGMLLILICVLYYAVDIVFVYGSRGLITSLMFLGIAAAKALRLVVSSAAQGRVLESAAGGDPDEDES